MYIYIYIQYTPGSGPDSGKNARSSTGNRRPDSHRDPLGLGVGGGGGKTRNQNQLTYKAFAGSGVPPPGEGPGPGAGFPAPGGAGNPAPWAGPGTRGREILPKGRVVKNRYC